MILADSGCLLMRLIINVLPKCFASCPAFSGKDTWSFHLFSLRIFGRIGCSDHRKSNARIRSGGPWMICFRIVSHQTHQWNSDRLWMSEDFSLRNLGKSKFVNQNIFIWPRIKLISSMSPWFNLSMFLGLWYINELAWVRERAGRSSSSQSVMVTGGGGVKWVIVGLLGRSSALYAHRLCRVSSNMAPFRNFWNKLAQTTLSFSPQQRQTIIRG